MTHRNNARAAIRAIQQVSDFHFPPTAEVEQLLDILCEAVSKGFQLESFPDKDSGFQAVGEYINRFYKNLNPFIEGNKRLNRAFQKCTPPDVADLTAMNNNAPGFNALIAQAVTHFLENADKYHEARVRSAQIQMGNDGEDPSVIAALVADKTALRAYISQRTNEFRATLLEIKQKVQSNDPFDMPTEKELLLYNKHSSWLDTTEDLSMEYLPNDNAVPYTLLLTEILVVIWGCKEDGHTNQSWWQLRDAYADFAKIANSAFSKEGNKSAYRTLSNTPNVISNRFDVGLAVAKYVSDVDRNAVALRAYEAPQLQTSTQRSVRRLMRILQTTTTTRGQFTIINTTGETKAKNLIELDTREKLAKAAIAIAQKIAKGAEGLSDAESMVWLHVIGREFLYEPAVGRNDLAVPALTSSLTNAPVSGFKGLTSRPWAFNHSWTADSSSQPDNDDGGAGGGSGDDSGSGPGGGKPSPPGGFDDGDSNGKPDSGSKEDETKHPATDNQFIVGFVQPPPDQNKRGISKLPPPSSSTSLIANQLKTELNNMSKSASLNRLVNSGRDFGSLTVSTDSDTDSLFSNLNAVLETDTINEVQDALVLQTELEDEQVEQGVFKQLFSEFMDEAGQAVDVGLITVDDVNGVTIQLQLIPTTKGKCSYVGQQLEGLRNYVARSQQQLSTSILKVEPYSAPTPLPDPFAQSISKLDTSKSQQLGSKSPDRIGKIKSLNAADPPVRSRSGIRSRSSSPTARLTTSVISLPSTDVAKSQSPSGKGKKPS